MKKQKTRRKDVKFPGLNPNYNSKIKQEYLDYDYVNKLSDKEKAFLNKFTEEYYGAALDVHNLDNNMHNTQELKKDCQDRNNARNRCIYSIHKATNRLINATYSEILPGQDRTNVPDDFEANQTQTSKILDEV